MKVLKDGKRYYSKKGIIKYYNVIVNRKNFNDQPIDSDITQYEEVIKLMIRLYNRMFVRL